MYSLKALYEVHNNKLMTLYTFIDRPFSLLLTLLKQPSFIAKAEPILLSLVRITMMVELE